MAFINALSCETSLFLVGKKGLFMPIIFSPNSLTFPLFLYVINLSCLTYEVKMFNVLKI